MSKTFAIGYAVMPKHAEIWCEGTLANFYVINGGWHGSLKGDQLFVRGDSEPHPGAMVVWEGEVPMGLGYNEALDWINNQIVDETGTLDVKQ